MNFENSKRITVFKKHDKRLHCEKVTRTPQKAEIYCLKEETRIDGPWEYGTKPVRRDCKVDWDEVYKNAKLGEIENIPTSIIV